MYFHTEKTRLGVHQLYTSQIYQLRWLTGALRLRQRRGYAKDPPGGDPAGTPGCTLILVTQPLTGSHRGWSVWTLTGTGASREINPEFQVEQSFFMFIFIPCSGLPSYHFPLRATLAVSGRVPRPAALT